MVCFRYVSLLRQRSTTTTTTPDDRLLETTTKDNIEEPRENKNTKVSDMTLTTESILISTILFNTEPFTETITTTVNVPTITTAKSTETSKMPTSITEEMSDTTRTTKIPASIDNNIDDTMSTMSTTKAPTSTVTNVITSIYEAATERQRVRVKNIQNFLLEHKKTELVTQSITPTTTPLTTTLSTTIENMAPIEEPTQKSILKGRFGGPVQFRPTLRKFIGTPEKNGTTTEKITETTTEKIVESSTEKKNRLNKYINRFIRPANNYSTESTNTTSNIFVTSTTESTSELSTRQVNRFRQTTSSTSDYQPLSTRRFISRYRQRTTESPVINNTDVQRSRFFRSRRPISSTTTTTEETTITELLDVEENADNVRYETTTYAPITMNVPTTNVDETLTNDEESKITTIDSFEPTKFSTTETTTIQPITKKITKYFRGSVRANSESQDGIIGNPRSPSLGRQNSRFLKNEQKILFIKVMPSPDGRSLNEFTTNPIKNVTRNRGKIRAYDSLELNTLTDELANRDRSNELFRGSETKFRPTTSTTTESTEEV